MTESIRVGDDPIADPDDLFVSTAPDVSSGNVLEQLRATLAEPVERGETVVNVLQRPGVSIVCHTGMTQPDRKAWQKSASSRRRGLGGGEEVDEMKFALLVVANTCVAIRLGGVEAHDEEGTPLTFRHRQLWDMLGAADARDAIQKLFVKDAHVLLASGEVLVASGFDDDLSGDPTAPES